MRLGRTEKRVLLAILEARDGPAVYRGRCSRYCRNDPGIVALILARDRLWGESVTPAQKAAFSRALRTLEEKGLIRTHSATRTTAELTPEGEQVATAQRNVNYDARASKLTLSEGAAGPGRGEEAA